MYILLLVVMPTPTVMPTLDQTMPTTTATSTPTVMPTLDQMTPTTTVMSTPSCDANTLIRQWSQNTPKQVVYAFCISLCVCVCGYRYLHLLKNSNRNNITFLFCRDYPWA